MYASSLLLTIVALTLGFLLFRWKRRRLYELIDKMPGPKGVPLLGNGPDFRGNDSDVANFLLKSTDTYPGICRLWLGPVVWVFLSKPEYLEIFLNSPNALDKGFVYNFTKFFLGDGLGTANADPWKKNRKMISPSFSSKVVNEYPQKIVEQCEILIDLLAKTNGKVTEICKPITNFSVDAFFVTIMGMEETDFQKTDSDIEHYFEIATRIVFLRVVKVWYHLDCIFKLSKHYKNQMKFAQILINIGDKLLEDKRKILLKEKSMMHHGSDIYKPFPDQILLKNPKCEMSDEQLLAEFRTFFIAGTDTNANTLSFVLTALGIYKDIQQRVYDEVIHILGPDRQIQLEDLSKLQYCERVIKETLRLIPALPNIGRLTSGEIDLGDYTIPAGIEVFVAIYSLHRNPQYWPNPSKFDPDRFLPENSKDRHPYAWLPFSGGPRNCIGIKYGMMVLKIALAMIIRQFVVHSEFKDLDDIELTVNIVTKCKQPLKLSFTKRA